MLLLYKLHCIGVAVRLVGGSSYNEGRVEVYYNGKWGTVCDDGWDDTDAGVVCRQLGFGSSGTAVGSAGFGQRLGSIWLNSVMCTGSESTLASCGHLGVGITSSCNHNEDAGVICSGDGKHYYRLFLMIQIPVVYTLHEHQYHPIHHHTLYPIHHCSTPPLYPHCMNCLLPV